MQRDRERGTGKSKGVCWLKILSLGTDKNNTQKNSSVIWMCFLSHLASHFLSLHPHTIRFSETKIRSRSQTNTVCFNSLVEEGEQIPHHHQRWSLDAQQNLTNALSSFIKVFYPCRKEHNKELQ